MPFVNKLQLKGYPSLLNQTSMMESYRRRLEEMVTRGLQWIGHLLTRDEYEPVQMAAFYRVREEERNTYKELNFEGIILVFVCRSV